MKNSQSFKCASALAAATDLHLYNMALQSTLNSAQCCRSDIQLFRFNPHIQSDQLRTKKIHTSIRIDSQYVHLISFLSNEFKKTNHPPETLSLLFRNDESTWQSFLKCINVASRFIEYLKRYLRMNELLKQSRRKRCWRTGWHSVELFSNY